MKICTFRKTLFTICKECFEKFFNEEERAKSESTDTEKALIHRQKLFGNLDFVGELYRRKLLPETVLTSVLNSLLGISDINDKIDDLVVEGAVRLMNKVGEDFEQRSKKVKAKTQKSAEDAFALIVDQFAKLMNREDETLITNRIKYLIKNMFANKASGWEKTKDLNEGGPKTKAQVQSDVQHKYDKEKQALEEERNK